MADSLYIIDGHAQIYRAYYALPGLRSRAGEPTGAVYGFVGALLKLLQARKPACLALAMDAGSSRRERIDSRYKAHRKPMPEDLPPQIERISQITRILGVPILRVEGFEADDVIATLVEQLRRSSTGSDLEIFICSRDKDLDQLIDPATRLYDIQTGEVLDAAALYRKKGYRPEQAADVLALAGDAADNIFGIPGVGPKTAAKWIAEYGTLDNLLAHADRLPGKVGQALRENLSILAQSRQLVRLRVDLPLAVDLSAMRFQSANLDRLAPIFQELDFQKLAPLLQEARQDFAAATFSASVPIPMAPVVKNIGSGRSKRSDTGGEATLFGPEQVVPDDEPPRTSATPHADATRPDAAPAGDAAMTVRPLVPPNPTTIGTQSVASPPTGGVTGDYRLVHTPALLEQMLADLVRILSQQENCWLAVDTETDSLGAMRSNLCGISLCAREGLAWYVAVKGMGECLPVELVRRRLGPLLQDPGVKKIGQNLKYDINVLRKDHLPLDGIFLDTMVASYVLDAARRSHSLDSLARDYLGLATTAISDLIGKGARQISFAQVPLDRACRYSAEDADVTFRLARLLHGRILREGLRQLFFDLEMPLVSILADMEYAGVKVDVERLKKLERDIGNKLEDLRRRIPAAAGVDFNPDSPRQLADVLFNRLGLPVIRKTKTGPGTDMGVLEALADQHAVPALILEYRQLAKLKNTYLEALAGQILPRDGRVHASFNQTIAETGRLSSSDPNLQNIPIRTELGREIRRAFVAADADFVLLAADYSQIELRVLAHFCREPALLAAFAADQDIHQFVAAQIYHVAPEQVTPPLRRLAKTVNFGIIYGQGAFGLAQVLKIPRREAEAFIHAYRERFSQIGQFTRQCIQEALERGYVTTILGRRRKIPEIQSPNPSLRRFGERAAVNTVVQGSAADLIKTAMVHIQRRLGAEGEKIRLILQVHDELVFECRRRDVEGYAALIRDEMQNAMSLTVPLKVDIGWGDNWLEAK